MTTCDHSLKGERRIGDQFVVDCVVCRTVFSAEPYTIEREWAILSQLAAARKAIAPADQPSLRELVAERPLPPVRAGTQGS